MMTDNRALAERLRRAITHSPDGLRDLRAAIYKIADELEAINNNSNTLRKISEGELSVLEEQIRHKLAEEYHD